MRREWLQWGLMWEPGAPPGLLVSALLIRGGGGEGGEGQGVHFSGSGIIHPQCPPPLVSLPSHSTFSPPPQAEEQSATLRSAVARAASRAALDHKDGLWENGEPRGSHGQCTLFESRVHPIMDQKQSRLPALSLPPHPPTYPLASDRARPVNLPEGPRTSGKALKRGNTPSQLLPYIPLLVQLEAAAVAAPACAPVSSRPQHTRTRSPAQRPIRVSDKETQGESRGRDTPPPWHRKLAVVSGWALKWSNVAPLSHRRGPRVNRSSDKENEKGRRVSE
ncbi:unnamed protein product [Pleuronectes platessa]|uniref:Uncharacterized protein n=1 Tax=Pleuronectes platessa TaxID=8262 RepID=A0A9N7YKZ4_PLEPL|nr:unnamed protein product [Pleuronectes platessa]